ncbi:MAG: efflux RND transporter periplasmic adaptor subunit [Rhodocyclaceae bacterium]|nr:efflux RND transporter periplasmic adaptor subunit [Rhodocyclaceae bacterium]
MARCHRPGPAVNLRLPRPLLASLLGLALLGVIITLWRGGEARKAPPEPAKPSVARTGVLRFPPGSPQLAFLKEAPAEAVDLPASEPLNARLALDETVTSRVSAAVAGRVLRVGPELGDAVRAGDTLLSFDSPDFGAAQADLRKAEVDAAARRLAWQRAQRLFDGEAIARRELDEARATLEISEAEVARARLKVRNLAPSGAAADNQNLSLRAPIAGTVVARNVTPGQELRPDLPEPLFVISDTRKLWLLVDLPVELAARVRPGDDLLVRVDGPGGDALRARVDRLTPTVDPVLRRVALRAILPNPDGRLRPEQFARVALADPEGRKGVRIPAAAAITEGVQQFAFVRTAQGEFVRRQLQPVLQDDRYVYLPEGEGGIAAGEQVVTAGAMLLNAELASGD